VITTHFGVKYCFPPMHHLAESTEISRFVDRKYI